MGATDACNALETPYPRPTLAAQDGSAAAHPWPQTEIRAITLEAIPEDDGGLLDAILPLDHQGGCIAVVCNTVDESIALARTLGEVEGIAAKGNRFKMDIRPEDKFQTQFRRSRK